MPIAAILAMPLLAAAAPAGPQAPKPARPMCQNSATLNVNDPKPRRAIHPLGEEPPARAIRTVLRTVDGCSQPVVIREDIGAPMRR